MVRTRAPRTTTYFLFAGLLAVCATAAHASKGKCSFDQRSEADEKLRAITKDRKKRNEVIARHLPFGVHKNTHAAEGGPTKEKLLVQGGYVLRHDGDLRTALWTSHELTRAEVSAGAGKKRTECFRRDERLRDSEAATRADYDEPIFDRGHMTSDRDLRDSDIEQLNSYVLSNIAPQYCRFNRGIWLSLEKLGRTWAKQYETVYITSGALFDFKLKDARDKDELAARVGSVSQTMRVAIPSHYYKIFLRNNGARWSTIGFLLEHHNGPRGAAWNTVEPKLRAAIKPLNVIEQRSEVTFHPKLNRSLVDESKRGEGWDFMTKLGNLESGCRY